MLLSSPPRRGCFGCTKHPDGSIHVFPASAGVFQGERCGHDTGCRLPRLGGGVSSVAMPRLDSVLSSPPRRGCFHFTEQAPSALSVFPASAGVFLKAAPTGLRKYCLPRLGGGVSYQHTGSIKSVQSSPPRRGCFSKPSCLAVRPPVFPASAGVFPGWKRKKV